ncbi:zinc finger protein [Blumeria hordei DH14]|uniref:Palmitoyltransferase PFA4 n=1 Tax=Blumeria graminis f. sp. hordei (strain DH14) TaxID=546991 RepID=N1JCH8_BLUG1|nr:zinc finger protein [Blumeria hordei DH14]
MSIYRDFSVPSLKSLAIPAVSVLIIFLAYTPQYLFFYIEPGPLNLSEAILFNLLVLGVWWCYGRACTVSAAPPGWVRRALAQTDAPDSLLTRRWCKQCQNIKPPRAHHCRSCGTCIPKMDHHCPWTGNCVSHTTQPHFVRFLAYAVGALVHLASLLSVRVALLWRQRREPAYLGPTPNRLALLWLLLLISGLTLSLLALLLARVLYGLLTNTTMIESGEIDRHAVLLARARRSHGYVYAPGGHRLRIEPLEFPYDIGFWPNLCQAMGTANVLLWWTPWASTPSADTAVHWPINGFNNPGSDWPPPDPDKFSAYSPVTFGHDSIRDQSPSAFKLRQEADLRRRQLRVPVHTNLYSADTNDTSDTDLSSDGT